MCLKFKVSLSRQKASPAPLLHLQTGQATANTTCFFIVDTKKLFCLCMMPLVARVWPHQSNCCVAETTYFVQLVESVEQTFLLQAPVACFQE